MTDPMKFALILGAFGFVCGLLMRGGINAIRLNRELSRAEAEGYTRAVLLMSNTATPKPKQAEIKLFAIK